MSTAHPALLRITNAFPQALTCLLLVALSMTSACDREPGIIVNIAAWPDGVERIRVRSSIGGTMGTDFFLDKNLTRFAVRVPVGSQGSVQIDAAGLDARGCRVAQGSLNEPVPDNLSRFVERTLEIGPPPSLVCMFAEAVNIPLGGSRPTSLAVGDFDGDGKLDLAVADFDGVTVSVLRGSGQGGFILPPAHTLTVGARPSYVAVGDFNGDTKPDLAVANWASDSVSILLRNILGGFDTPLEILVGTNPSSIAVGDFNSDMKQDLLVANYRPKANFTNVTVLEGKGDGKFTALPLPPANTFLNALTPQSIAVADFDGDTRLDLAVANINSHNVSIVLGDGLGGYKTVARNYDVGMNPVSVAVGEFNGDSQPDLAVANNDGTVSVQLGGQFDVATSIRVGVMPQSVAVADFDGDKKSDLVIANYGSDNVVFLRGDGRGSFVIAGNFPVGVGPEMIAVGDFDGDMKPDLAVANYMSGNVSILLNRFD